MSGCGCDKMETLARDAVRLVEWLDPRDENGLPEFTRPTPLEVAEMKRIRCDLYLAAGLTPPDLP